MSKRKGIKPASRRPATSAPGPAPRPVVLSRPPVAVEPPGEDLAGRRWAWNAPSTIFSGPRPTSFTSGLEPAFLLFETEVMESLRERAARRKMQYDTLVRMIVRDHVAKY